jgi:hypothetical protein
LEEEYELEKRVGGAPIGNVNASKQSDQNDHLDSPCKTRERIAQEYELEKKLEGRPKKNESISEKLPQNEGIISPTETAERLAKEHGMSRATVERSADLFRSHQAVIATSKPISLLQDEYIPWPEQPRSRMSQMMRSSWKHVRLRSLTGWQKRPASVAYAGKTSRLNLVYELSCSLR